MSPIESVIIPVLVGSFIGGIVAIVIATPSALMAILKARGNPLKEPYWAFLGRMSRPMRRLYVAGLVLIAAPVT